METSIQTIVGSRVRRYRNSLSLSQEKFAKACGLDRTYIASVELGRRNISIKNLEKIAKALGVPLHCLVDENTTESSTVLLNINGISFILESNEKLTAEQKDELELICRYAYEEESDLVACADDSTTANDLCDKSVYELAELFQMAAKVSGISVRFKAIDLELSIME